MEIPNLSQWQNARLFLLISLILQEVSRRMEVVMSPVEFVHQGGLTAIGTHENEGTEANGWGGANNVHVNEEEEVAEGDDAPPWRQPIDHEEGPQEPQYPPPKRRRSR